MSRDRGWLGLCFPKMGWDSDFGAKRGANCLAVWAAGDQASCSGVNLVFAGFRACLVFPEMKLDIPFDVGTGMNCLDFLEVTDQAPCCGMNLAFGGWLVWFPEMVRGSTFRTERCGIALMLGWRGLTLLALG